MQTKLLKTATTFACILFSFLFSMPLPAQDNTYDKELKRLEKKLPKLSGKEKIDTLYYLVQHTVFSIPDKGRAFLKQLEEEAIKQNNIQYQAFVKKKIAEIYFYQFDTDSLFIAASAAEDFARKHQRNEDIFQIRQLIIQRYAFQGEYAKAIKVGRESFDIAKEIGDNYGMAMATAGMASNYNSMCATDDAINLYKESIELLKKANGKHNMLYLDLYMMLVRCYDVNMDNENTVAYADTLLAKIEEYANEGTSIDLHKYRFMRESCLASMYLEREDTLNTRLHIAKMDSLAKIKIYPALAYELNAAKASYYMRIGQHEKALVYFKETTNYIREQELTDFQAFRYYADNADVLLMLKRYEEAANLYKEAANFMIENFQQDLSTQMGQLRIMYDLDKLEMQAEKDKLQLSVTQNRLMALIIAIVLLSAITLIVSTNMRRTRKKNISLVQRIREQDLLEEEVSNLRKELEKSQLLQVSPEVEIQKAPVSQEEALILKLKDFLKDNPVYTDPAINRRSLAEMIGSNESYVRAAIKEQLGYTFTEYMNELRLNYAKSLLASSDNPTIDEIAAASGFNSRSTLYRKFREKYQVTPDEYRKLIKRI